MNVSGELPLLVEGREGEWEWAVAARALAGRVESGDQCLIQPFPGGVLASVVDGLGHGAGAAAAARVAIAALTSYAHEPLDLLLRHCHEDLKKTRGVVMSLAAFDARGRTMTWLGVGNIRGVLLRADAQADPTREWLLARGGVVGYHLPSPRPIVHPIARGDVLIFATDGIHSNFAQALTLGDPPPQMAERVLARSSRGTDDALVLVMRCQW